MSDYNAWNEKARLIWAELNGEEEEPLEAVSSEDLIAPRTIKNITKYPIVLPNDLIIQPQQSVTLPDSTPVATYQTINSLVNKGALQYLAEERFVKPGVYVGTVSVPKPKDPPIPPRSSITGRASSSKPNMEQIPPNRDEYRRMLLLAEQGIISRRALMEFQANYAKNEIEKRSNKRGSRVEVEIPPNVLALEQSNNRLMQRDVAAEIREAEETGRYIDAANAKEFNKRLSEALGDAIPTGTRAPMDRDKYGNIRFKTQYTCSICGAFCTEPTPAATLEVVSLLYGDGDFFSAKKLQKKLRRNKSYVPPVTPRLLTAIMGKKLGCRRCRSSITTDIVANAPGIILRRAVDNYRCSTCKRPFDIDGLLKGSLAGTSPTILLPNKHEIKCRCGNLQVFRN